MGILVGFLRGNETGCTSVMTYVVCIIALLIENELGQAEPRTTPTPCSEPNCEAMDTPTHLF